jgi:hypothetical protein
MRRPNTNATANNPPDTTVTAFNTPTNNVSPTGAYNTIEQLTTASNKNPIAALDMTGILTGDPAINTPTDMTENLSNTHRQSANSHRKKFKKEGT